MSKKKKKMYVLKSGVVEEGYTGMYIPGYDLNRIIRDELRSCGYPCINCLEPDCTKNDPINPNIRLVIEDLQRKIQDLQDQIDALS